jgi:hypothetical protein
MAHGSHAFIRRLSISIDTWAVLAAALLIVLITLAALPRVPW